MGFDVPAFLVFLGITLAINVPLMVLGMRRGRTRTVVRSVLIAAVIAAICAIVQAGGERLVNQCLARGNPPYNCNSVGEAGMQVLFVIGFAIFSLLNAWWLREAIR